MVRVTNEHFPILAERKVRRWECTALTVSLPNDSARTSRPTGGFGLVKIMIMTRDDSYGDDDDENDQRSGWVCVAYHFPLISGPRRRWLWQLPFSTTISTWWGRQQHQYSQPPCQPLSATISTWWGLGHQRHQNDDISYLQCPTSTRTTCYIFQYPTRPDLEKPYQLGTVILEMSEYLAIWQGARNISKWDIPKKT